MGEHYAGEPGKKRVNVAIGTQSEEAVEILFQQDEITVKEAKKFLEQNEERKHASERRLHLVYERLADEGLIDREELGDFFRALDKKYSVNGHSQEEVMQYVETYREQYLQ